MQLHHLKQLVIQFSKSMNLKSILNKIGKPPLFIIDNWSSKHGYVCFDFDSAWLSWACKYVEYFLLSNKTFF